MTLQAKNTLFKNIKQIFASQYQTYLPTKEEFQAQLAEVGSANE